MKPESNTPIDDKNPIRHKEWPIGKKLVGQKNERNRIGVDDSEFIAGDFVHSVEPENHSVTRVASRTIVRKMIVKMLRLPS